MTTFDVVRERIDPNLIKPGDTVTLKREGGHLPNQWVAAMSTSLGGCKILILKGGLEVKVTGPGAWAVTDHQPARETGWKPGTSGKAVVGGDPEPVWYIGNNKWVAADGTQLVDSQVSSFTPDTVLDPAEALTRLTVFFEMNSPKTGESSEEYANRVLSSLDLRLQ